MLGTLVQEHFDLRPGAIIRDLELEKPVFAQTAAYGHFGRREPGLTWEADLAALRPRRARRSVCW
jgi:S-adenosylmethionine synthetase